MEIIGDIRTKKEGSICFVFIEIVVIHLDLSVKKSPLKITKQSPNIASGKIPPSKHINLNKHILLQNFFLDYHFFNNKFIGDGRNGLILTSNDGITWDKKTSGSSEDLKGIYYGN